MDELVFVRNNKIEFTGNDFEKVKEFIYQKKVMLDSFSIKKHPDDNYYDIAITEWRRVLKKIEVAENQKNESYKNKKDIMITDNDNEIKSLNSRIWQLLYSLKDKKQYNNQFI
jgi:hypothetical protein